MRHYKLSGPISNLIEHVKQTGSAVLNVEKN